MKVKEKVDAKAKLGRNEALELAGEASVVSIAKGKKVVTFAMNEDRPNDDTLLSRMLGRTGNLRAPALRVRDTLLVGFNKEMYESAL